MFLTRTFWTRFRRRNWSLLHLWSLCLKAKLVADSTFLRPALCRIATRTTTTWARMSTHHTSTTRHQPSTETLSARFRVRPRLLSLKMCLASAKRSAQWTRPRIVCNHSTTRVASLLARKNSAFTNSSIKEKSRTRLGPFSRSSTLTKRTSLRSLS